MLAYNSGTPSLQALWLLPVSKRCRFPFVIAQEIKRANVLFNSLAYLIFLPIVVTLFWVCPKRCRTIILLLASYVFYMSWKPIYGLLIVGLTALNYVFGLLIAKSEQRKKLLLTLAVASNLLLLAYFKYTYFLIDTANQCLASVAQKIPNPPFEIIFPLGISFFVFEILNEYICVP